MHRLAMGSSFGALESISVRLFQVTGRPGLSIPTSIKPPIYQVHFLLAIRMVTISKPSVFSIHTVYQSII